MAINILKHINDVLMMIVFILATSLIKFNCIPSYQYCITSYKEQMVMRPHKKMKLWWRKGKLKHSTHG